MDNVEQRSKFQQIKKSTSLGKQLNQKETSRYLPI